ncbi:hypothetical protein niasHT_009520 [Heterodera trifolii]|uniref:TOG domain-containing protein n=1 Tax=Heterodera trifolii TaxID=157864 RepID=A0ABD2M4Z4_9BILA
MSSTNNNNSSNNNTAQNSASATGTNVPMLNQLLAVATEAQGVRPTDPNHCQMSEEDRAWLEAALGQIAADSDPVKKLKRWMTRLEEVGEPSEANLGDIDDILEEIGDLVCDMDLAQYFCSLGGIELIQRFLAKQFDPCSALLVHLVAVLAQYNERVQQLMLRSTTFLPHCLDIAVDSERSVDYRHKCVGAISAMVKAYLPALIRFVELNGPARLMRCFEDGAQMGAATSVTPEGSGDRTKLAHRCAVAAVALKRSFSVEVLNANPSFRRVAQCPAEMRAMLANVNEDGKWNDTLEFLAE